MRTLFPILLVQLCLLHSVSAQDKPLLDQKIQLEPITASMQDALQEIGEAGGFSFSYSDWVNPNREVRLPSGQHSLSEWLELLFPGQNMTLIVKGDKLIIRPARASAFTLSGYVRDAQSGETLIGATVRVADQALGTQTNAYGFYSLSLPPGSYDLVVSYLGYERDTMHLKLDRDLRQEFTLEAADIAVAEIVISESPADKLVRSPQMSLTGLSSSEIQQIPALMGEADVLKAIQFLPGVKTLGEGSSGLFVRGGNLDRISSCWMKPPFTTLPIFSDSCPFSTRMPSRM